MAEPERSPDLTAWADRYDRLLGASGLDRRTVLNNALQGDRGQRRRLFSLAQCLAQPDLLIRQIAEDYPHACSPQSRRAYLSVLHQGLALSVIAPLTVRLFRDGQAPAPNPDRIFLEPLAQGEQTTMRWFQAPDEVPLDESGFIHEAGKQTSHWYPTFRQAFGVSPGAYWSSVGLGLGAPFSAVWNLAEPNSLCDLAQQWLAAFNNDTDRFVGWIPAVFGEQTTAIPQRKGCCLKYLLPEGGYCGTCGVYRKQRMAALSPQGRRQTPGQWRPERQQ
ncbi:(2Fe-2S)-binding protein [Marinobacter sp. F4216]|uniref:(2Fe-2S)-binding protein n=1 Tax=Marinobacter sp. F4216 TaxID=2874281 RepID=UPI001CC00FFA|nr:(2Fe-2S)-binding protein [Marinobacter sp. F4216]MBZ2169457.1 (2Fe-2S)-binding protein [Marinobacter sp. F4216]